MDEELFMKLQPYAGPKKPSMLRHRVEHDLLLSANLRITPDNKKISPDNKKISPDVAFKFSRKFEHSVGR
jgi:hypothetical protein